MKSFTVVGAGLSGLFAAALLRDECKVIVEAQKELPNNHSALLRFRTAEVGSILNIPFEGVDVIKTIETLGNNVKDAISYSLKTNGSATLRSITSANGEIERRWIAPSDFVLRLSKKVTAQINFNESFDFSKCVGAKSDPVISTIPMPILAQQLEYEFKRSEFKSIIGYTCNVMLKNCDACATIYFPNTHVTVKNEHLAYRASITKNNLIVEYAFPNLPLEEAKLRMRKITDYPYDCREHLGAILRSFGMDQTFIAGKPQFNVSQYSKILPIEEEERKRFIIYASEMFNIYSFGRFATWRPGLLMDDLASDLRIIQRLARGGTSYNARVSA